jgi:UDPglucose--hexose-1-phosphate uridylyltransferase
MHKTTSLLADGRELIYYDRITADRVAPRDTRELPERAAMSQIRFDVVTGEWVVVADHRQSRTFQPQAAQCPLCPSRAGNVTEVPASSYEVVVFENRFPALTAHMTTSDLDAERLTQKAGGRCEVICFSDVHDESFTDLPPEQARLVLDAWTDRSAVLSSLPGVVEVFCFENRGPEMGVTQRHPHGQIYAYPFVTPRTESMLAHAEAHRREAGDNLFDHLIETELATGERIVTANEEWVALVPYASRWPYEVHLYPRRRRQDLLGLDEAQRNAFAPIYLDLLARFDRLFTKPAPYVSAWHQAPAADPRSAEFATHLELFTNRRSSERLKVLGGTEVGMDTFSNDVSPERAAERLRGLGA